MGMVWVGYLWSNYECFLISGCKDTDFKKTPLSEDVLEFDRYPLPPSIDPGSDVME